MTFDFATMTQLAIRSVRDPRGVARLLLELDLPVALIWPAAALISVLSAILFALQQIVVPPGPEALQISPIGAAIMTGVSMVAVAGSIQAVGRIFGGEGGFWQAILLMTWMQTVLLYLQVIQTVISIITPLVAGLFVLLGLGLTFWLLINFTAVLHRFSSNGKAFGVLALAFLAAGVGLSILLSFAGFGAQG